MTKKTSKTNKAQADEPMTNLEVLDELIKTCYGKLKAKMESNPTLGDLLKMIELRRKLTPHDASQKELWAMLEKVRKDVLARSDKPPAQDKTSKSPTKAK